MGKFSFGAQRGFMPTEPAQPDPTMAVKPSGWQDKLGLIGATLRDVGSSLNGQGGNALAQQQQMMQGRGRQAAQQAALQQVAGSITDPQEKAVFAADPETWFKIYGERMKPVLASKGQEQLVNGQSIGGLGDYGVSDGYAWSKPVGGDLSFGAQRPKTYSEFQAIADADPNKLGSTAYGRVQGVRNAQGQLSVAQANSLTNRLSYQARLAAGGFGTPGASGPVFGADLPPGARLDP